MSSDNKNHSFFDELKRRNVYRVGLAYVVFTWLGLQVIDTLGPILGLPDWTPRLVFTILATLRAKPDAVAMAVGLYITAAYWFTASTSFANPAVTIARGFSDTFAGIRPTDVPAFIIAQLVAAVIASPVSLATT